MDKSNIILFLFTFILGCLIGGTVLAFVATKAMTKVQLGDNVHGDFLYTHLTETVHDYEDAQNLWPLLRYDTTFTSNLNQAKKQLAYYQSKPAVQIFFKNPLNDIEVSNLKQAIQVIPGVTKVSYVSKEDALNIYKQQNKNDKLLLSLVTADILPASLNVYVSDRSMVNRIVNLAKSKPFVSNVIGFSQL